MRLWLFVGFLLMALSGCGNGEQVQIRIRNDSDRDIEHFWLGAGGFGGSSFAYGAIPRGQTTPYQSFAPVLANYRKCNFITADGRQYLDTIYPERHIGSAELSPGRYTFAYDIVNDEPVLTLIQDQ